MQDPDEGGVNIPYTGYFATRFLQGLKGSSLSTMKSVTVIAISVIIMLGVALADYGYGGGYSGGFYPSYGGGYGGYGGSGTGGFGLLLPLLLLLILFPMLFKQGPVNTVKVINVTSG